MHSTLRPRKILPLIVLAQFLGTSSWFAGNAVLPSLTQLWMLPTASLASLTNSVQFGFILGALFFSLLSISDRFRPSRLFFFCAACSSVVNLLSALWVDSLDQMLVLRFVAGVLLAGIYPIGMKLAASWYPEGVGRALGYLLGSLALGTAVPHLFASFEVLDWRLVMLLVAVINLISGLIVFVWVSEGPNHLKPAAVRLTDIKRLFRHAKLRASAGGYFGHMWELYAIWAIAPLWIASWVSTHDQPIDVSLASFGIIGIGACGCVLGGIWSQYIGSAAVARNMLSISGVCCLVSPLAFELNNIYWLGLFWAVWGFTIVADSPQFSALSAQNAPPEAIGTALTLINALGFSLTLIAIQLSVSLSHIIPVAWVPLILAPGPLIGVMLLRPLLR